ncbi:two-component system, OmpR family, sensor histidine kinase VicK [Anaerolineae bacterium]|nr:two-component system, OmpR family, sensor histidine kinase VicK [Anaerolineae bacterium]
MHFNFSPYAGLLVISAILAAGVSYSAWQRRQTSGGASFAAMTISGAIWAFSSALEMAAADLAVKVTLSKVMYVGISALAPFWLLFALNFTRRIVLRGWRHLWLWIMPVITVALTFTNEWHGLIWSEIKLISTYPIPTAFYAHGSWFWVSVIYNYLLIITGIAALISAITRFPEIYGKQTVGIVIGAALPFVANIFYLLPKERHYTFDFTPLAFALTGVIYWFTIFRFRLFNLTPVARDTLIENMREGVIVVDTDGHVVDINQAAQNIFHFETRPVGKPFTQAFKDWTAFLQVYERYTHTTLPYHHNGRHFELEITALKDKKGGAIGRLLLLRDITERERIERQIRIQGVALEAAANAITITDQNGIIVWINPAFTTMTGYTLEEVRGRTPNVLNSGKHPPEYFRELWSTIKAGQVWHGEITNRRKDGSLYTEEQTIAPVRDQNGEIVQFIAIKQDVTERKQLERLRDDLTHMIVHDLRNPLMILRGSLEILEDAGIAGEEPEEAMQLASASTRRMLTLVNSILDLNQLEAGKMPIERREISLPQLMNDVIGTQMNIARRRGQTLRAYFDEAIPALWMDDRMIERVLQNLLDNALKFTPEGGLISVSARMVSGVAVAVSVKDSGLGINPDLRGKLFEKFVFDRLPGWGNGLGLVFCRMAVEAHGGTIQVEDTSQTGTTITFTLPVQPPPS